MRSSDIIVVGGGTVGLTTACTLAEHGLKVRLIESHSPGWGASGRNQGFLGVQTRKSGVELQLALFGRELVEEASLRLSSFSFRPCGGMTVFDTERDLEFAAEFVSQRNRDGLPMEVLNRDQALSKCPIVRHDIAGATWNPLDGHQNTGELCAALAAAAERLGVELNLEIRVTRILLEGDACTGVEAGGEEFRAGTVVLAAGVWSQGLVEPLGLPTLFAPLRMQGALTEPGPWRFEPIVYGPSAASVYPAFRIPGNDDPSRFAHQDAARYPDTMLLECIAQRPDGRVLMGCPLDMLGLKDVTSTAGAAWMFSALTSRFPELGAMAIERFWAGVAPMTKDSLPIIDKVPGVDGLILNTGHVFGNLSSFPGARVVAALLGLADCKLSSTPFSLSRLLPDQETAHRTDTPGTDERRHA